MESPSRLRRDEYDDSSPHPASTGGRATTVHSSKAAAATRAGARPGGTGQPKKKAVTVTPNGVSEGGGIVSSLSGRMSVEKDVINELLLVCGVIGTAVSPPDDDHDHDHGNDDDDDGHPHHHHNDPDLIVPVTDCLNWLQDLQRALRRDDDQYRPISILLSDWKVVAHKLLPVVLSCRYDASIVLTVCKILVILTKPLSEAAVRAGRMVIDTKKVAPEYVPMTSITSGR